MFVDYPSVEEFIEFLCMPSSGPGIFRRCKDDHERLKCVVDLVNHAQTDKMSRMDMQICLKSIEVLKNRIDSNGSLPQV